MQRVWTFTVFLMSLCTLLGVAAPARAQLQALAQDGSFNYGNVAYTITGCAYNGSTCSSSEAADIMSDFNERPGTDIEMAAAGASGSYILTLSNAASPYDLALDLQGSPSGGRQGLSSITALLGGAASSISQKNDVYSAVSGSSPTTFSAMTTNLSGSAAGQGATNAVALGSANFSIDLHVVGTSGTGNALRLTNVARLLNPVPEPAAFALFATGIAGLVAARRRLTKRRSSLPTAA